MIIALSNYAAHFLQIWIVPRTRGLPPSYTEWHPQPAHDGAAKVLVISSDGREGSATINQDVAVYRLQLAAGAEVEHSVARGRAAWVQVAKGHMTLNGHALAAGDGARTEDPGTLRFVAETASEALLFDLESV
jgi:quercetin 2,3-dioxygenase